MHPPEKLRILWLINHHMCEWAVAREVACTVPNDDPAAAQAVRQHPEGLMLDTSLGVCHHLRCGAVQSSP